MCLGGRSSSPPPPTKEEKEAEMEREAEKEKVWVDEVYFVALGEAEGFIVSTISNARKNC